MLIRGYTIRTLGPVGYLAIRFYPQGLSGILAF